MERCIMCILNAAEFVGFNDRRLSLLLYFVLLFEQLNWSMNLFHSCFHIPFCRVHTSVFIYTNHVRTLYTVVTCYYIRSDVCDARCAAADYTQRGPSYIQQTCIICVYYLKMINFSLALLHHSDCIAIIVVIFQRFDSDDDDLNTIIIAMNTFCNDVRKKKKY